MIQVITCEQSNKAFEGENIVVSSLNNPRSLDEFEINLISLENRYIWYDSNTQGKTINIIDDFKSIGIMLKNSKKAKNIIILPQNKTYYWNKDFKGNYSKQKNLKDMICVMCGILSKLYSGMNEKTMLYENTGTNLGNQICKAAFCFEDNEKNILTISDKSKKITTIYDGNIILTTLNLCNYDIVIAFLKTINLIKEKQKFPNWLKEEKMFDDEDKIIEITQCDEEIRMAQQKKDEAQKKLDENNRYKSILYTNGDELVEVVDEILEKITETSISNFVDKKKEDFCFNVDEKTFLGEIKGISSNVKNQNVSQIDVHYQGYLEEYEECEVENVHALLIINHQRTKPTKDREAVHDTQIALAKRNGSLIIETITLLKLFEKYLGAELSRDECVDLLCREGILTEKDLK